ncbi:MAG: c-type cytochrome [Novosphingobium sp.]
MVRAFVTAAALLAAGAALTGARRSAAAPPVLVAADLYKARCGSCHSLDANRIGPAHRGVVGRKAGTAVGFTYSPALARSGIVWNEANLDRWLQGPQKMVPGAKMYFALRSSAERAAIIGYLKSQPAR